MTSLEWELVINDKVCNGTDQILNRNPLTVNCANANITQCLTLGRHLHLKTSPSECARACKGISFAFMFGSNETDNSKCNISNIPDPMLITIPIETLSCLGNELSK